MKLKEEKTNKLFKATISFENDRYMNIVLYLVYNGKEKLKGFIPQIKFKIWEQEKFLTVDIESIKILEELKKINKNNKLYIKNVIEYVKIHQKLLLDYWNADIPEFEAKQIFFDETNDHFGCTSLSKRKSGLPMNLVFYCSYTLDRDNILFFQNDYGKLNYNNMIMMSVDKDNPQVLVNRKINIKKEDMMLLKKFIKKYYKVITEYNDDTINDAEIFDLIDKNAKEF